MECQMIGGLTTRLNTAWVFGRIDPYTPLRWSDLDQFNIMGCLYSLAAASPNIVVCLTLSEISSLNDMTLSLNLRLLFQGKMHKKGFKQSFCYFVIAARWRDWVLPRGLCKVKSREIKMAGWIILTPPPCCTSKKEQDGWREISEMLKTLLIEGHKNGAASKKFCQFRFRTTFYFLLSVLHALRLGLRSEPLCVILNKTVFSFSKSYWIKLFSYHGDSRPLKNALFSKS